MPFFASANPLRYALLPWRGRVPGKQMLPGLLLPQIRVETPHFQCPQDPHQRYDVVLGTCYWSRGVVV